MAQIFDVGFTPNIRHLFDNSVSLGPIRTFCTAEEFSVVGRHEIDHRPADLCEQQRS
jgi:hypothetical protein